MELEENIAQKSGERVSEQKNEWKKRKRKEKQLINQFIFTFQDWWCHKIQGSVAWKALN